MKADKWMAAPGIRLSAAHPLLPQTTTPVGANVTTCDDRPCSGGGQPREGATLSRSTTYAYCVKAYNQGGESACSNTVEATVDCGSITPTGLESASPALVSGAVDGAATQAATLTTRSFAPLPNGETHRSYYYFNGQRVAMRQVDAGVHLLDSLYLRVSPISMAAISTTTPPLADASKL
jgi:hypothetical protein